MPMTLRLCVTLLILGFPFLAKADQHKLAASSVNSTYHSAGVALEAATSIHLMPETGIKLTSVSTSGVRENIEQLSGKQVDFAIVPSLVGYHARTGTGSFSTLGPQDDLRAVAMLVPTVFHALVRKSAVQSGQIDDLFTLREQRLQLGLDAPETAGVARFLFHHLGANADRFDNLLTDRRQPTATAFQGGEIDALVTTGNFPIPEVEDLLALADDDIAILGITESQLRRANNGIDLLTAATIPAQTYPNQTRAIRTLALPVFLATRADVDDEVIYQITKIMFEQIGFLRTINPAMAALDFENAVNNLPVPLHPGAARYYRDYGLPLAESTTTMPDYPVYALDAEDPKQRRIDTNRGVVGIMVDPDTTSLQTASELAVVVNEDPSDVRIVVQRGEGSAKTINDLLFLKGVDIGIVQADVLDHLQSENGADWLQRQLHYLAKLYDSEVHILARDDIDGLKDLAGKAVNFGPEGSASEITAARIFSHLGIAAERTSDSFELALEKLKLGDIDALVVSAGKPLSSLASIPSTAGLKLLDVPLIGGQDLYRNALITNGDYPNLLGPSDMVHTVSVPAALVAYKWPQDSDRYRLLSAFFETLEQRLGKLKVKDRFHPKWQNVSLDADLPGWIRSTIATDPTPDISDDDVSTPTLPTPPASPLPSVNETEGQVRNDAPKPRNRRRFVQRPQVQESSPR